MSTIVYYVLTQRGGFAVKHTRIKMICIVIGMIPLLSTVVNAVSMGGFSLLHAAGDAETGELPKGTALCIAEAIPEEYSPEELITNTYHAVGEPPFKRSLISWPFSSYQLPEYRPMYRS